MRQLWNEALSSSNCLSLSLPVTERKNDRPGRSKAGAKWPSGKFSGINFTAVLDPSRWLPQYDDIKSNMG